MIGIRFGLINVFTSAIKNLGGTSETNQWKIHKSGQVVHTGPTPITQTHGLRYTPFFLAYTRAVGNNYYGWANANCFTDPSNISLVSTNSGDMTSYLILKDFGA